jgi:peptide-methionine (S)-S-oxide reductase
MEQAIFGAGCFWHVEEVFYKTPGVIKTEVGFMGGDEKKFPNPSYKDVCTDKTGYAEVVYLKFDPNKISYNEILNVFWRVHDPTQFNRQGFDVGLQYRSVIFYFNSSQKKLAEKSKKEIENKIGKKVSTEIVKVAKFVKAEEYHQKYFQKHPVYCSIVNLLGAK